MERGFQRSLRGTGGLAGEAKQHSFGGSIKTEQHLGAGGAQTLRPVLLQRTRVQFPAPTSGD